MTHINNYEKTNNFYVEWLEFIKNKLNIRTRNSQKIELSDNMKNAEMISNCILMILSRRLSQLEENFIKFEKENEDSPVLSEYKKVRDAFLNPGNLEQYNDNVLRKVNKDDCYELGLDYEKVSESNKYYYIGKDDCEISIPKVFEKIKLCEGMENRNIDIFYQVRNCLAHGDYSINLGGVSYFRENVEISLKNITIELDNGKVQGTITLEDLNELVKIYEIVELLFGNNKYEYFYEIFEDDGLKFKKLTLSAKPYDKDKEYEVDDIIDYYPLYYEDSEFYDNAYQLHSYIGDEYFDLLRSINYTDIESLDLSLEEDKKQLCDTIKDYCGSYWLDDRFSSEINMQKNHILNRYNNIVSDVNRRFDSRERLAFFEKFFGDNKYDIKDMFITSNYSGINLMDYYNGNRYNIYNYEQNNDGYNRLLGFEDYGSAPIIYCDFLLDQMYYNFNYVKETNSKINGGIFKFENLDLDDFEVYKLENDELVSSSPYEIKNKKNIVKQLKNDVENDIINIIRLCTKVIYCNNNDSRFPNKEADLQLCIDLLKQYESKYDFNKIIEMMADNLSSDIKLDSKLILSTLTNFYTNKYSTTNISDDEKKLIRSLKNEVIKYEKRQYSLASISPVLVEYDNYLKLDDSETTYKDASYFIAKLRNSITHGNYKIKFDKAFDENGNCDFDNIVFDFYDVNPLTNKVEDEVRNVTAKRLRRLLQDYSNLVINTSKQSYHTNSDINEKAVNLLNSAILNLPENEKRFYNIDGTVSVEETNVSMKM